MNMPYRQFFVKKNAKVRAIFLRAFSKKKNGRHLEGDVGRFTGLEALAMRET
jgi:hypothetical protein